MSEPWTQSTLETPDGASLNIYSAVPDQPIRAIIQINHGMAEHAARYERFAEAAIRAGYGVYAHDHRGHGYTKAPNSTQGHFARQGGWDLVLGNVDQVNQTIRSNHPDCPIICFGHSMGSIIAFNYALRHPTAVDGLALWNSGVEAGALAHVFGFLLKTERMFKGSDVPSKLAKKLTFDTWNKQFVPNRTDYDWLSRDQIEVDKYIDDPLCGFDVTVALWLDVLNGIQFAADDKNLKNLPADLPVHLQAGEEDPCSEKGTAVQNIYKRMEAVGMQDVSYNLIKDARHESLNETDRDKTTANFMNWLDQRFFGASKSNI